MTLQIGSGSEINSFGSATLILDMDPPFFLLKITKYTVTVTNFILITHHILKKYTNEDFNLLVSANELN